MEVLSEFGVFFIFSFDILHHIKKTLLQWAHQVLDPNAWNIPPCLLFMKFFLSCKRKFNLQQSNNISRMPFVFYRKLKNNYIISMGVTFSIQKGTSSLHHQLDSHSYALFNLLIQIETYMFFLDVKFVVFKNICSIFGKTWRQIFLMRIREYYHSRQLVNKVINWLSMSNLHIN